ncbi:replication protein A 70 kDa DNA-binding subunit-like isoform X2 [Centropristis striata]|uniref:replication protein A 70 kDa DNA-binding subunit-like isoform X2 n=1 Tax=Centropristis striata TaxID=184440 RepID=UPI0027DF4AC2|nr:replication protein A 70 kDa DNA-binding subunit-like isoform X2 [Centropristis striata]
MFLPLDEREIHHEFQCRTFHSLSSAREKLKSCSFRKTLPGDMSVRLTQGAIQALASGIQLDNSVLQLLKIGQVKNSSPPRFRLSMSDGQHSMTSFLLATQMNYLQEENLLEPHCVCLIKKTTINTLSDGRNVVCVLDMDVLHSAEETGMQIGNPTPYGRTSDSAPDSTFVPASPLPAAVPGPSYRSDSSLSPPRGSGRGFLGKSPMKASSMQASPSKFSPMKASPMQTSPSKFSPMNASPAQASPFKFSPMNASPAQASPSKFSPMKASPMQTSPSKFSPMKASPAQASPSKFSPMKASPSKYSPMKAASGSPGSTTKVFPIADLNPYISKWTIRARVTNKSNIRTWSNSKGEGKLFSFEMVDESGEIRITAFNKEVDKFFSLVEQGKVYYITKGTLKVANKQYTKLKNDYEITLHSHSSIVPCEDSQGVPAVLCEFVPIAELENRDKDDIIDVIGVCKSAEDVSRITTKTSREVSKRALNLIDTTGKVVTVTLWGEEAEKFDGSGEPVVAIKGARLSDFGGISLSALFSSTVMVNPDLPEAFSLRAWYDQGGFATNSQSLTETRSAGSGSRTNWKTLSEVKEEDLGHGEKADYFSCVATVVYTRKENCLYRACPSADCNKKVIEQENGLYRCEKCNREFPNFKYRLLLSANLADYGDNQWVTCFQETAEVLLGHSVETLGQLRDADDAAFDEVFQKINFTTHIFRNKIKLEMYNDESRVKVTVMEVQSLDHREYSRRLLSNIHKLASCTWSQPSGRQPSD